MACRLWGFVLTTRAVWVTPSRPLVLGSASPRRRELVARLELPLSACVPSVDEAWRPGETPDAYLERVALAKLEAVRGRWVGDAAGILVADTIVVSPRGAPLGKPSSPQENRYMLDELQAATHDVRTRFVLAGLVAGASPIRATTVITRVTFRALSDHERDSYAECGEGADKAGGYAIQGKAEAFVASLRGSYSNVVGLPLCEVAVAMREIGWIE